MKAVYDVRHLFACFYVDNRLIAAHTLDHLQLAFSLIIALFDRVGLQTNAIKRIRMCLSEEAY